MQSEESARRIVDMGADPEKVVVTGSLKFDSLDLPGAGAAGRPRPQPRAALLPHQPNRPVIIAASTLKGEEEPVFEAFQRIRARVPETLLIIAPRKPERFAEVEQLARRGGWNVARRSELPVDAEPRHDVIVLDTFGELAQLYQVATAVFVGGSLVDAGGHNILEPAVFGKPIVFGPYMQNFAEIARAFLENDAARSRCDRRASSSTRCSACSNDPVRRARLGAAARALVEANRGARGKTMTAIARCCRPQDPGNVRPFRVVH